MCRSPDWTGNRSIILQPFNLFFCFSKTLFESPFLQINVVRALVPWWYTLTTEYLKKGKTATKICKTATGIFEERASCNWFLGVIQTCLLGDTSSVFRKLCSCWALADAVALQLKRRTENRRTVLAAAKVLELCFNYWLHSFKNFSLNHIPQSLCFHREVHSDIGTALWATHSQQPRACLLQTTPQARGDRALIPSAGVSALPGELDFMQSTSTLGQPSTHYWISMDVSLARDYCFPCFLLPNFS